MTSKVHLRRNSVRAKLSAVVKGITECGPLSSNGGSNERKSSHTGAGTVASGGSVGVATSPAGSSWSAEEQRTGAPLSPQPPNRPAQRQWQSQRQSQSPSQPPKRQSQTERRDETAAVDARREMPASLAGGTEESPSSRASDPTAIAASSSSCASTSPSTRSPLRRRLEPGAVVWAHRDVTYGDALLDRLDRRDETLTEVDLTPEKYSWRDVRYALPALMTNTQVTKLCLPLDRLDDASARCVALILEREDLGPSVQELYLFRHGDHLRDRAVSNLTVDSVSSPRDRHENDEHPSEKGKEKEDTSFSIVVDALRTNRTVTKFVAAEGEEDSRRPTRPIEGAGIRAIALALHENKALKTLSLRGSGIDAKGATKIACALASNGTLESLDLSNNPAIGNEGAKSISLALEMNSALKKMKLSGAAVGSEGAAAFASALSVNACLEVLDVSRNRIGDAGAAKVAKALKKKNRSLRQVSFRRNRITDLGASCLLLAIYDAASIDAVVNSNHTLRYLNIDDNNVGTSGEASVPGGTRITDASKAKISEMLLMNRCESGSEASAQKIGYFLRTAPNLRCMWGSDTKCMPRAMAYAAKHGGQTVLYELLRTWNMSESVPDEQERTREDIDAVQLGTAERAEIRATAARGGPFGMTTAL